MARRKSRVVAAAMTSFLGRYETVHAANILQNSRLFGGALLALLALLALFALLACLFGRSP